MKYFTTSLSILLIVNLVEAQFMGDCMPRDLIVVGEGVNFRSEPNTSSASKGKLINGELLSFMEVIQGEDNTWVKVKRVSTGESGFVFGKYVKTPEMAYRYYAECDRIQSGNWYGLVQEGNKVIVEKTIPVLQKDEMDYMAIVGKDESQKLLICSQSTLQEGPIIGKLFDEMEDNLTIGNKVEVLRTKDRVFSLICTGEVELESHLDFSRKNEKIYFVTEEVVGTRRLLSSQDLSDCIQKFGEVGYSIVFAGDLNNDGIPEVILYEATTQNGRMYYFMSNKDRKLELKGIAYSSSKC